MFGNKRSKGAAAVVTGAGSGIGAAFAREIARRGGQVVCSDIDLGRVQATVAKIEAAGGRALGLGRDHQRVFRRQFCRGALHGAL